MTDTKLTAPPARLREGPDAPGLAALEVLLTRSSNNMLTDPAPDGTDLDLILQAASRAPDHGRLCPWRFVLIRGAAREDFIKLLREAALARDPDIPPANLNKLQRLGQTPLIVALGTDLKDSSFPESEQELSAAAAAMNVLNAVHAMGYAGKWVTGANSHDPLVHQALGFTQPNRILGFLLIGTARMALPEQDRPAPNDYCVEWTGPGETRPLD